MFGPGYGESIVVHIGEGTWIVIDSCVDANKQAHAITYLRGVNADLANDVALIVATHWHDDHIRGISQLVESCPNAAFSCAAVLCGREFFEMTDAMEDRNRFSSGAGTREVYRTFEILGKSSRRLTRAISGRLILDHDNCRVWALSPFDQDFTRFLLELRAMVPGNRQPKKRSRALSPNDIAVVLRIEVDDIVVLLGADLERRGWRAVLGTDAPAIRRASAFKIPHHGSESANDPDIWSDLLIQNPFAVVSPWRRGKGSLPTQDDVNRILASTPNAYVTSRSATGTVPGRDRAVERTIREAGIRLRSAMPPSFAAVRLRHTIGQNSSWAVERFGSACHLSEVYR